MSKQSIEIVLSGECTIYEVAEWQQKIITQWADKKRSLSLNLSGVSEMDASFVQLLLGCKKTTHEQGLLCELTNVPPNVENRLQQMYVFDLLIDQTKPGETQNG